MNYKNNKKKYRKITKKKYNKSKNKKNIYKSKKYSKKIYKKKYCQKGCCNFKGGYGIHTEMARFGDYVRGLRDDLYGVDNNNI